MADRRGFWRASMWWRALAMLAVAFSSVVLSSPMAQAQDRGTVEVGPDIFVGDELERYLRVLQNSGRVPAYPWSVRGFSPAELSRLVPDNRGHPWANRYEFEPLREEVSVGVGRFRGSMTFNSAFPYGGEGPVWAGRGLTTALQGGLYARYGPLTLMLAPILFRAENGDFDLAPTGLDGEGIYRSPASPRTIDRPQRFGEGAYTRLEPGNSTLRLDAVGFTAGASTASQFWGPARDHPLVLGSNAGGFPHIFAGTASPADIYIGRVHGRLLVGRLAQSPYSPVDEGEPARLMNGLVILFSPRGLEGLEVGLTRFFQRVWPDDGLGSSNPLLPLESFIKERVRDPDERAPENQLASAFFRWNFSSIGVELGGEYMREDHSLDIRTLVLEPDDLRAYLLAFRKVWTPQAARFIVLDAELMNAESPHRLRAGSRPAFRERSFPLYGHGRIRQGHTHRGKLLATPYGHGGAAAKVGVDWYHPEGRTSLVWERALIRDRTAGFVEEPDGRVDVAYALGGSIVRFRGPLELAGGVHGVYNLNRHFREDAFNLHVTLSGAFAF